MARKHKFRKKAEPAKAAPAKEPARDETPHDMSKASRRYAAKTVRKGA